MARDERALEAPPYSAATASVLRLPAGRSELDRLAVEEPLEIRIDGRPIAVTMRTPGHDEELALGFCLSEGIPARTAHVPEDLAANTVEVDVSGAFDRDAVQRNFYTSSSCGVCGKGALEAVAVASPRVESELRGPLALVTALPERLRAEQAAFAATGGLHATGLFDQQGQPLCVREDVGRHNAMDKVVGWAHGAGLLPLVSHVLCVSGRLSFELVQKAAVAGCPLLVAVGLPVDVPRARAVDLLRLAEHCADAAVPQTGPLPGAYRRSALTVLERCLASGELVLHEALDQLDVHIVELDPDSLVNVNEP